MGQSTDAETDLRMGVSGGSDGGSGKASGGGSWVNIKTLVVVVFLGVICYQVYLGVHLSEVGVPGVFTVKFQSAGGQSGAAQVVDETPSKETERADGRGQAVMRETTITEDQPPPAMVSRDFFVGRWAVRGAGGSLGEGTLVDYFADGTFAGTVVYFDGIGWRRENAIGAWRFTPVDEKMFAISWQRANGERGNETFVVLDRGRIRNVAENYIAERVP